MAMDWVKALLEGRQHISELRTRLVIKLGLMASSGVSVGAGVEPGTSLKRLFKIRLPHEDREAPVLLASSLKGALRAISERLAKTDPEAFASTQVELMAIRLHHEAPGKPIGHVVSEGEELREALSQLHIIELDVDELGRLATALGMSPDDITDIIEFLRKAGVRKLSDIDIASLNKGRRGFFVELVNRALALHCPICKLYGAPSLAGKLRLVDGLPEGEARISVRIHVGIDRATGTHRENILYHEEVVEPSLFTTYLIVDNVEFGSSEARLLASTLEFILKLGLRLGGSKSRGLGFMKPDLEKSVAWLCDFEARRGPEALEMLLDPRRGEELGLEKLVEKLRGR